jgi:hypothetical protein
VDDVPGAGDACERRQQEQNRRRAAGHGKRGLDFVGLRVAGIDLAVASFFPQLSSSASVSLPFVSLFPREGTPPSLHDGRGQHGG